MDQSALRMIGMRALAVTVLLCASYCKDIFASPIVHTANGAYSGLHSIQYDQDYFLGIPYAQAPVGSLRFQSPLSLNETWSDIRSATQYSSEVSTVPRGFFFKFPIY